MGGCAHGWAGPLIGFVSAGGYDQLRGSAAALGFVGAEALLRLEPEPPPARASARASAGVGPMPVFAMPARLEPGSATRLHFFEPRYRWLCRRIRADGSLTFAFVTSGCAGVGAVGALCVVPALRENEDGTFDAVIFSTCCFRLLVCFLRCDRKSYLSVLGFLVSES